MRRLFMRLTRLLKGRPGAQRGYALLALAVMGLTGATVVAIPVLQRASNTVHVQRVSNALTVNGAISAAEHAIWMLENDQDWVDSFTGEPPCGSYELTIFEPPAQVEVCASSEAAPGSGLHASLTVEPSLVAPNTPTTVTYTMRLVNNSTTAHEVIRVDAEPQGNWGPACGSSFPLTGTTAGYTPEEPTYTDEPFCPPNAKHARRWEGIQATVPPFGGEGVLQWQAAINEGTGNYTIKGEVRVEGVGFITAPNTTVRVSSVEGLDISTSVSPSRTASGDNQTIEYQITVINTGEEDLTMDRIRHYAGPSSGSEKWTFVSGSAEGITTNDPSDQDAGGGETRRQWTWNLSPTVTLVPNVPQTLTFKMEADLMPGIYYVRSNVRVEEDEGGGQTQTADTADTAPITVVRQYSVHASHNGSAVDAIVELLATGADIVEWEES